MKEIELAYGRTGLQISLADDTIVLTSKYLPGVPNESLALQQALRAPINSVPLAAKVKPGDKVAIVHSDLTRATPNERILPVLIAELEDVGIDPGDITMINGLGTHRPQTESEMRVLLGDKVFDSYRCLQHDAFKDDDLVPLGTTASGNPVRVNRHYFEADVRILTGFIEPHFFAGFSGGPKGVLPALAGFESVLSNHGWAMIADPQATWGVCEGNPIWEEMKEVALRTEPTFLLNVTLNARQEITAVFAGEMLAAHRQGREFVHEQAMVEVADPFDIVITTNSGYPLDQNLYQTVKGMSAAARVVRQGGSIIMAAACEDGLPDHGLYASLLAQAGSPEEVLEMLARAPHTQHDQWQVQIQALVQQKAEVFVFSDGLTAEQIRKALFTPCFEIEDMVAQLRAKYGPDSRVCVMPEGPLTIAYLAP